MFSFNLFDLQHGIGDSSIYITEISPNGEAKRDGRLRVGDIILEVGLVVLMMQLGVFCELSI